MCYAFCPFSFCSLPKFLSTPRHNVKKCEICIHDVEWPCPNRSIRKTRLFFKRCLSPHIMVFEPRVCTSLELAQATGACSAERSCERWLGGWPSPASSIELELHSTKSICAPVCELEPATAADGRQARHRLGPTATRSRRRIAAWRSPRRGTT